MSAGAPDRMQSPLPVPAFVLYDEEDWYWCKPTRFMKGWNIHLEVKHRQAYAQGPCLFLFCVVPVRNRHAGESYSLVKGLYTEAAEVRARADAAEATHRYCAMAGA